VVSASSENTNAWTTLAHLLRPQGRKGEILADLLTDFPDRFPDAAAPEAARSHVFLAKPNFAGTESEARPISVTNHWLPVGRNHGRIVLTFEGIDSISQAEALMGLDVIIPTAARVELDAGAEYISDLIGCTVFDGPTEIGAVASIEFPTTPDDTRRLADAAPLLTVLTPDGHEILIPYVESFLVSLDPTGKRIDMTLPPGLLDLNRP